MSIPNESICVNPHPQLANWTGSIPCRMLHVFGCRKGDETLQHPGLTPVRPAMMDQQMRISSSSAMRASLGFQAALLIFLAGRLSVDGLQTPTSPKPDTNPTAYRSDRLLIEPDLAADAEALRALHHSNGARIRNLLGDGHEVQVLEVPQGTDIPRMVDRYWRSGLVLHAEPDFLLRTAATPNDPSFASQWSLHNSGQSGGVPGADIGAVAGWNTLTSASNVVVAIIDSGIRYTHEDLADNMWKNPGEIPGNGLDDDGNGYVDDLHGINSIDRTGEPMDPSGHGTHVAGIIGAVGDNGVGISGVAWRVQLMALRFIDDDGSGATSDAIECIDYARQHGAHIINASWGGGNYSSFMERAIRRARDAGILLVTGAGNDAADIDDDPVYPGSYNFDNIVVVTGTDSSDALAWYSNYGSATVHLAAPGSQIYSTYGWSDTAYAHQTGTSMSAPLVAGAFALMRARYPEDDHPLLIERLLAAVNRLPTLEGKTISGGRLNIHQALGPSEVAPAIHVEIRSVADGRFELRFEVIPGWTCWIEASPDLVNWTTVDTFTPDTKSIDEEIAWEVDILGGPPTYYRVRLEP
jgi:subtilisin family serine protease